MNTEAEARERRAVAPHPRLDISLTSINISFDCVHGSNRRRGEARWCFLPLTREYAKHDGVVRTDVLSLFVFVVIIATVIIRSVFTISFLLRYTRFDYDFFFLITFELYLQQITLCAKQ